MRLSVSKKNRKNRVSLDNFWFSEGCVPKTPVLRRQRGDPSGAVQAKHGVEVRMIRPMCMDPGSESGMTIHTVSNMSFDCAYSYSSSLSGVTASCD